MIAFAHVELATIHAQIVLHAFDQAGDELGVCDDAHPRGVEEATHTREVGLDGDVEAVGVAGEEQLTGQIPASELLSSKALLSDTVVRLINTASG